MNIKGMSRLSLNYISSNKIGLLLALRNTEQKKNPGNSLFHLIQVLSRWGGLIAAASGAITM